jgi:hypothetical protein
MSQFEQIAERYADDDVFRSEVDRALGVRVWHLPMHPPGECEGCDAARSRQYDDLAAAYRQACTNLANYTFRGKDVSLGEEADEWQELLLRQARDRRVAS